MQRWLSHWELSLEQRVLSLHRAAPVYSFFPIEHDSSCIFVQPSRSRSIPDVVASYDNRRTREPTEYHLELVILEIYLFFTTTVKKFEAIYLTSTQIRGNESSIRHFQIPFTSQ